MHIKIPLRISACKWEGKIKMDIREPGCKGVYLIQLTESMVPHQSLMKTILNLSVLIRGEKFSHQPF